MTRIDEYHGAAPVVLISFLKARAGVWALTSIEADAVLPVPPLVEVTLPVTLFLSPAVDPVTVMLNVQLLLAAIEPPLNATVS